MVHSCLRLQMLLPGVWGLCPGDFLEKKLGMLGESKKDGAIREVTPLMKLLSALILDPV